MGSEHVRLKPLVVLEASQDGPLALAARAAPARPGETSSIILTHERATKVGATSCMLVGDDDMAKRNGNREVRKPKQDKQAKVQAATSISQIGSATGLAGRRR